MIDIQEVRSAMERIQPFIFETPMLRVPALDKILGCQVYIKPENMQRTGSFKIRGALNKILSLDGAALKRGVVAASSGNHGKGVAFASKLLGASATIVMPESGSRIKRDGILSLGASVMACSLTQRHEIAAAYAKENNKTLIPPSDYFDVIAGQGTIGLEIVRQMPEVDAVVAPVGGGGLLAGVALAVAESKPGTRIVGVEPAVIARYAASRSAGRRVTLPPARSVADALLTLSPGECTLPIVRRYVSEYSRASEDKIVEAVSIILEEGKLLAEPSAALGVAAVIEGNLKFEQDEKVCFIISGGNVEAQLNMQKAPERRIITL